MGKGTKSGVDYPTLDLQSLSRITESSPLPVAALEGATHIVRYVNPAFCRLVGKHSEALVGIPFARAVPDAAGCLPQLDQVYHTGGAETCVTPVNSVPHPLHRWYVMWAVPGTSSRPAGVMLQATDTTEADAFRERATAMNQELVLSSVRQHELTEAAEKLSAELQEEITRRKQMEEELRKSRDELELRVREKTADVLRLAAAVDKSAEATVITDSAWVVQYANPAFLQLTGYRSDEVIGREMTFLRSEEEDQSIYEMNRQAAIDGTPKTSRHVIKGKGGTRPVESLISSVRNDSGTITNFVFLWRNISEQLSLEEQLRQAHKMEAIGTLAGGIAHDFNNILAAILGFTELSIDDAPEGSLIERNMTNVLKAGIRGRDLVRQILMFSRKSEYERKPLPLAPLIKETFDLLRASLPTTIEMTLNVKTAAAMVLADATQMQQVLMNLCNNAADAMRATGGRLEIGLADTLFTGDDPLPGSDMRPGTYVTLTVSDTGPGMDEAVQKRVFEPFFTTKEIGQGTGLGLAVVYGIVKAHQGAITVSSEPGRGSTFTVYLPRDTSGEKAEPVTDRPIPRGTERILFVDDDEALVELAEGLLHGLGYEVTGTTDSVDALRTFSERPNAFDLVITDQTMPEMTGAALAQKLKEIRPNIPIILCTGYSETIAPREAESMGIQAFVIKPLLKRETAETIRRVLDRKSKG